MEVTHSFVLLRHGHCLKVIFIANSFKIATYQEQIYFVLFLGLQLLNVAVNCIKFAMTAAFNGNLQCKR